MSERENKTSSEWRRLVYRNKGLLRLGVSRKSWGRFSYEPEKVPEEVNTTRGREGSCTPKCRVPGSPSVEEVTRQFKKLALDSDFLRHLAAEPRRLD